MPDAGPGGPIDAGARPTAAPVELIVAGNVEPVASPVLHRPRLKLGGVGRGLMDGDERLLPPVRVALPVGAGGGDKTVAVAFG